jgi:hypothetical protein
MKDKKVMAKVATAKVKEHESKMHGKKPAKMANGGAAKGNPYKAGSKK